MHIVMLGGLYTAMPIVTLRIPASTIRSEVDIAPGQAVLVGRDPDKTHLAAHIQQELMGLCVRLHRVDSPQVSLNHLLLRGDAQGVLVLDLHSRNGTWLRTPSADWTCVTTHLDEVLELALTSGWFGQRAQQAIAESAWQTPTTYAQSIVTCIRRWLQQQGVTARIHQQAEPSCEDLDAYWTLPLADGTYLRLEWDAQVTHERCFRQLQEQIAAYVHAENQRYLVLCDHDPGVVLSSAPIRAAHDRVVDAALKGQRLVLIGPTGSGKDVLAHCLHRHSVRNGKPFVAVNCAQLRNELLYAQLFGARRGAFTGAVADLQGLVDLAHGGTLFLDELAEMDASTQRALLRFLDRRGEYLRLGDVRPRFADVQIVCATSTDLASEKVRESCFRDDLWYRLAVRVVRVPPLSQRPDDLIGLLQMRKANGGKCSVFDTLTPPALERVLSETWPGNFRDLENFLQRLPTTSHPGSIDLLVVERALGEGKSLPTKLQPLQTSSPVRLHYKGPQITVLDKEVWSKVLQEAADFFLMDHAGPPRGWAQIHLFTERYLKPIFVACSAGLRESQELPDLLNYSKLARQLGVSDGTTIKSHLQRYLSLVRELPQWRKLSA